MNAPLAMHAAPPCAPPAPIAASAAACWRGRTADGGAIDRRRSRSSGEFRPALLQGLGARRDAGARRPAAASDAAARRRQPCAASTGTTRSTAVADGLRRIIERARAGRGRLLSLRPVADRGLLRRQQADEGLHRLGQCRHQFAPVHGLVGRRPSPRLRRRHGAGLLRGPRPGRSASCWSAPTPPGAIRCCSSAWCGTGASAAPSSSSSIRAARRPAKTPTCSCRSRPAGHGAVLRPAGASRRRAARSIATYVDGAHAPASPRRWRARASIAPDVAATAAATGLDERRRRALLRAVPRDADASSPASRRASTSRRRAPTRSTPSSIAISPPAASAGRAWGRSRSPASPTRWAGARSAGSPTSSPRTWTFAAGDVDRVRPLLERAAHGGARGPEGRADVRGDRARRDQGAVGDGDQSGGVAAARRRRARGAAQARPVRRLRERAVATTPSHAGAHVLLPAAAWGEKDGTVTNSERRISRQRAFLPLPGEAQARLVDRRARWRSAWALATRSPSAAPADVFREHAALSAFENDGARDFDIGALAAISDEDFDALEPVQWPVPAGRPGDADPASSPTAASSRPTARRASSRRSRRRCASRPAPSSRSGSTPAACATSGTP